MKAGRLRHRVKIQEKTLSRDGYGGLVESWSDCGEVWASVEPLQGRELAIAQQVIAETTAKITIRYLAGVDANMRVLFEGRIYNILAVVDWEMRHIELQLLCSEGVNDG